ncbi:orotate phosphoribosyltransferase [Candidatus Dependentiae bacterium]|nr:orotate phosphoribosyltransferase [Candidatus Dependentiae bacterium]
MNANELNKILKSTGALLKGHFRLSSGKHSNQYVQCALLLQWPELCTKVAKEIKKVFKSSKIDLVIGPALGGVTLAYEVAKQFKVRAIWTERKNKRMVLSRGFDIKKGERVLVVEDVITTGGSVKEVIKLMEERGAVVVGVASIINRSDNKTIAGYPYKWLLKMNLKSFDKKECPQCKLGLPSEIPGSRKR